MTRRFLLAVVSVCAWGMLCAQDADYLKDLKPYRPEQKVTGTIRLYGNNYIPALVKQWEDGFRKYQPDIHLEASLVGTEAAVAGVYANIADVALVGREVYRPERNGFIGRLGYAPLEIEISSGSYATPHKTFSLQVFVHRDNPLARLTMAQLEAVFGANPHVNQTGTIRTWGQLGLTGEWVNRPIHVYGYSFDTGMARYFQRVVLNGSYKWNPEMKDLDNGRDANGEVINAGVYILQALAKDPYGIAFANVMYANPEVKTVALARSPGGPYVEPTEENTWRRLYPITRFTTAVINRPPGKPVDPKVKEFLRYLLSRDGMEAVVRDGSYLPLTQSVVEEQLRKLE